MKLHYPALFLALFSLNSSAAWAQSTACMVLGAKDAVVQTNEGKKSPVFLASNCSVLKLISGKAQASWIGRDGKPRLVPITETGVHSVPSAGSEERSVNVVWSELTSQRERQQPAYMRTLGGDRAPKVFVPEQGLDLIQNTDSDAVLSVFLVSEDGNELVHRMTVAAGQHVVLPRKGLKPDHTYAIQIQRGGGWVEEWRWRLVTQAVFDSIDESLNRIEQDLSAPEQQSMLKAMLYEQLKMRVNMDFEMQNLRTLTGSSTGTASPPAS